MGQRSSAISDPPRDNPGAGKRPSSGTQRNTRRLWLPATDHLVLWLFGLLTIVLVIMPIGSILYGSLRSGSPGDPAAIWTLANLRAVYLTNEFVPALTNTVYVAVIVTALATVVGTGIAWLLARTDIPWKGFLEMTTILPLFLSPFIGAIAWIVLASPRAGYLNSYLGRWMGLEGPLVNIYSVSGIIWVMTLFFVPYAYLLIVGALRSMDPSLEEASNMLGGGVFQTLWRVTIPLSGPAILSSALLIFVLACEVFTVPALLGSQIRFYNLTYEIYKSVAFYPPNFPKAAAAGTMLLWLTFGGMYLYQRALRQSSKYVTVTARGYRSREVRLGRLRWPAVGLILLYGFVTVVLPYLVLLFASFQRVLTPRISFAALTLVNYRAIVENSRISSSVINTLFLSTVGATGALFLAIFVGFAIYRTRLRGRRAMEYVGMLPHSIPSLVLAVGFLWAYIRIPLPIYGTLLMLIVAYITRYLSYGLRGIGAGLVQVDPVLDEAAAVAGASKLRVLKDITIPLLKPAMVSTWILMFIVMVRQVEMALLLYTPRSSVMSVMMWELLYSGEFAPAAALAVVQATLVFACVFLAQKVFRAPLRGV